MSSDQEATSLFRKLCQGVVVAGVLGILLAAVGCGGGGSTATGQNPGPGQPKQSAAQVKMGDAPADRVVSFEVTVGPITMTPVSGSVVTALASTRRLELSHLSGTNEPLALLNLPQGSYSSASIAVSNPEVSFINNAGTLVKLQPALNQTITVNFSPALSVGAGASVVNIDLGVANSLTFDAQGNVTGVSLSASSFSLSTAAVAAEDRQGHEDGELEDTTGLVASVSGSSFTMNVSGSGVSLTFSTDANTQFNDGAALATMTNMIVTVEGVTKSDGSLYAGPNGRLRTSLPY